MYYRLICLSLCIIYVFCQTTDQLSEWTTDFDTTLNWSETTAEYSSDKTTNFDGTENSQQLTTEKTSDYENSTTAMTTNGMITTDSSSCPGGINPDILEEMKKEMIDQIVLTISNELTNQLNALEARLSKLIVSNENVLSPVELDWQIYENLQIELNGWTRVFDQPYNHKTRIEDLTQIAGICHNQVLVGATFNGTMSLAAVGPASILTINTKWNQPQQFGQVYWYRTTGKSFGFSPLFTIRQTSADNEDLNSPLRLSWALDQNIGGYRAGTIRSLQDNSLWHKVIYCNPK